MSSQAINLTVLPPIDPDIPVDGRWRIRRYIGDDTVGAVYEVEFTEHGLICAMKSATRSRSSSIEKELMVYKALEDVSPTGFALTYWDGIYCGRRVLIMSRLGNSLESWRQAKNGLVSMKSILQFGRFGLERLKTLHDVGYIHRDLRLENFTFGVSGPIERNILYLINFHNAVRYEERLSCGHSRHIPFRTITPYTPGSLLFGSFRANLYTTVSRRDDLESFVYCLIYLAKGTLPWDYLCNEEDREDRNVRRVVSDMKRYVDCDMLFCGLPRQLQAVYEYVRNLGFFDAPDYSYLRNLFASAMTENGIMLDSDFE